MACPDKKEDEKILAAIEQRKAAQTPVLQTETRIWPGRLLDYLVAYPEENILMIEKVDGNWVIVCK
jgi:hypothetical protein